MARWLIGAAFAYCSAALAQDKPPGYPVRPIRLIVAVAPGAGADAIARAAAQMLTDRWGTNAVVDNRPGGSGVIAMELVARSAPDGYTLLSLGDTLMLLGALKRVSFDVLKEFEPVVPTSAQPYILLVNLSLPVKSIKELVAYSATQTVTYSGAAGVGSTVHLGMERLAQLSGAKLLFVPYKGSAPAILAVMGGEIHMAAASSIAASGAIRTGKVRALAALGLARIPTMPDLPTVAEQGFPGFKITNRYNLYAPAGTPRAIVAAINRVVSDGMHSPQMAKRLEADGSQPAERMTPEQLKATVAREYAEIVQQVKQLAHVISDR
ncbi:MAG TPA: tripartite tricarboxylate transporter substrate binding protein [Burkholderiales bacterium]|nr:tripartite tricarboxylate transporter substrate binding protein [Burkholderiales bacterium]